MGVCRRCWKDEGRLCAITRQDSESEHGAPSLVEGGGQQADTAALATRLSSERAAAAGEVEEAPRQLDCSANSRVAVIEKRELVTGATSAWPRVRPVVPTLKRVDLGAPRAPGRVGNSVATGARGSGLGDQLPFYGGQASGAAWLDPYS